MSETMMVALAAGGGVALVAGPLGSFVVWRRLAYFGDALAHSALLGVALGLLLGLNPSIGVVVVCLGVALVMIPLQQRKTIASDTLLGIMAHGTLALGLLVLAAMSREEGEIMDLLLGDIRSATMNDLIWIYVGGCLALGALGWIWKDLLSMTVHEELARVEGVNTVRVRIIFMILIALTIAFAMKLVGILLMTSLLIIPAAAARRFSRSPEQMAVMAAVVGLVSVVVGLLGASQWALPPGPSVVVAATGVFVMSALMPSRHRV